MSPVRDNDKRNGTERRGTPRRKPIKVGLLNRLRIVYRRTGGDRRSGLDRRDGISSEYRKDLIIKVTKKFLLMTKQPEKAKMTYIWRTGLRAITFETVKARQVLEISIQRTPEEQPLILLGKILKTRKIFTEHGFATEADVQFCDLTEHQKKVIKDLIWSDAE
ncbi:MAG: hypothetical protein P9M13_02865 [Candidatus Ancaeobacter aquaticus]|nr:hypothetical protein [Candidatus Ancaeobacter aquaticus]